jgi:hypothetical protein
MGTYIQDIPEGPLRERHRAEILGNVEKRRDEALTAFSDVTKYMGIIISGGTIAILGFIGSRKAAPIPVWSVYSLLAFVLSILSFSLFLYLHYLLQQNRWNLYADMAHRFFTRDASLEEMIAVPLQLRSRWLYHLLFWVPFALAVLGFFCGAMAAFSLTS